MAVSIIIYQHLDNIDGKQARKTSTNFINLRFFQSLRHAFWSWGWCSHCFSSFSPSHEILQNIVWIPTNQHFLAHNESVFLRNVEPVLCRILQTRPSKPSGWRAPIIRNYLHHSNANKLHWLPHRGHLCVIVHVPAADHRCTSDNLHGEGYHEEEDSS